MQESIADAIMAMDKEFSAFDPNYMSRLFILPVYSKIPGVGNSVLNAVLNSPSCLPPFQQSNILEDFERRLSEA